MGQYYPTMVCRLCGGKVEGHRVYIGARIVGTVAYTTCEDAGKWIDSNTTRHQGESWRDRMAADCQARRENARAALTQPIRAAL